MNNLIICEGVDDTLIIGYYLYKTEGWIFDKDEKFSEFYSLPKVKHRNEMIEVYKKDRDRLALWCVGGKDNFDKAFHFLKKTNNKLPTEGIQQLFIFSDRDNDEIEDCLANIENAMKSNGIDIKKLENRKVNVYNFEDEGENYKVNIIPIVIPFDEVGALETVLMNAIEETGDEEKFIVREAQRYVEKICESGQLRNYLQHSRQILKAKFSSCISITNPDRSTALFNTLLMSCPWEEKETMKRHFGILNELL